MPAVTPISVGVADMPEPLDIDLATAIAATQSYAQQARAAERRILSQDIGDFANDAAAIAWAAAQSPPISVVIGSSYWNTTTHIKRICSASSPSVTFVDEDADAQTQRTNANTSAVAAAGSAAAANASAVAAAATLADFANKYAGAYSSDPTYVGPTPPWVLGSLYFNTVSGKLRVWKSAIVMGMPTIGWHDYDESAVASAADAAASASTASGAAATAATKAGDATTQAGIATSQAADAAASASAAAIREANAAASAAAAASASAAALAGSTAFRNRIINGNFDIWQRGTSFSVANVTFVRLADQWSTWNYTGVTATISKSAAPSGFVGRQALNVTATGVAANNGLWLYNRFEGRAVADLDGLRAVASFDINATTSAGALALIVNLQTNGALDDGSYSSSSTDHIVTVPVGSGRVVVPFSASDTAGLKYGGEVAIQIVKYDATGNINVSIGAVQFEADRQIAGAWGNPTPFEFRPFSVELAMCQRFYQLSPRLFGFALSATDIVVMWTPIVPMHAAPTATLSTLTPAGESPPFSAAFTASSATLDASHIVSGVSGGDLRVHGFSGLTTNAPATLGAGAIALSAEL